MNKTTIEWCHGMTVPCEECGGLGETVAGREVEVHQSRLFPRPSTEDCRPCNGSGKIPRQGYTWNPTRGCSRVSPGCVHCYAETLAGRFAGAGLAFDGYVKKVGKKARWTGKVELLPGKLADPLKVRRPGAVFVNSMSDLFHEALTFEEIAAVVGVMAAAPQHLFMTLTKRAARMREWFEWTDLVPPGEDQRMKAAICANLCEDQFHLDLGPRVDLPPWPLPNWRIGISAEDQQRWDERVPELLRCPAAFRFVSAEPLISGIDCRLLVRSPHCFGTDALTGERVAFLTGDILPKGPKIHQVIVGSESGPGARPMDLDWARSIRDQCHEAGCAFFMKQVSTPKGKKLGMEHFPDDLKIRDATEPRL